ncbi:MAG: hypothetical protein OCD76_13840 [Reichenbachiella sp.]
MELVLRNVVTLSTVFSGSYDLAFDYLADPFNQKEWAVHFVLDVERINGEVIATLPFGKMPIRIESDRSTGVIDIYLGDGPSRTRLIEIEDKLCVYNFTLAQPKDMPDEVWKNQGLPNMEEELNTLRTILESK